MLRRLGIRGKVLAALAGPVLVLVLIASLLSWQSATAAKASGDGGLIARILIPHADVVVALQGERTQATALASGRPGADVETARATTDRAIAEMVAASKALSPGVVGGRIADLISQAVSMQAAIDLMRGRVIDSPEQAVDTSYTEVIAGVVAMPVTISERLTEPDLAAEFRAYGLALIASEQLAHESPVVRAVLLNPEAEIASVRRLGAMLALTDSALGSAQAALETLGVDGLRLASEPGSLVTLRQSLSSGIPSAIAGADATQLAKADAIQHELVGIRADLLDLIAKDAAALQDSANRQALLTAGGALLAVLLSVALALTIARGIVRPMRSLTKAALTVRDELPRLIGQVAIPGRTPDLSLAEIPVTSNDEVGKLAAAFNEVNATTIQVAQEQAALRGSIAEMFVNVARRDQVLLNRQLSFIDALERSEEDPKVLADLFRLDHLATRMRRNAESLLVLAGIDTGRRLRDTLLLSDVVRTASSEIEHYERVLLDLPTDPIMLGHTALPAAHLLAELLENATMFAEPGSPVHVSTGRDETHVLITVLDQGMGMSPEELDAAQAKIASASAGEVLGAQRLGMFVIGRIAARLGAKVELAVGPHGNGTQATVRLPLALFVDIADVPLVAPIVPASAMSRHFPVADPNEVPEVASRPVNLADLTDGATGLGLPRRRVRGADVAADAPSAGTDGVPVVAAPDGSDQGDVLAAGDDSTIPAAPEADALAGAAATVGEDWTPLVTMGAPLSRRRRGQHAAPADEVDAVPGDAMTDTEIPTPHPWSDGSTRRARNRRGATTDGVPFDGEPDAASPETSDDVPADGPPAFAPFGFDGPADDGDAPGGGEPAPAGLPSRTPSAMAPAWPPPAATSPVAPDARATMFNGFRSRRAETVAEQLAVRAPEQLAAPALEQILVQPETVEVLAPQAPAFLVPLLVDDEEWEVEQDLPLGIPVAYDDAAWAPTGHVVEPWEDGYEKVVPTAETDEDEDWAPMPELAAPPAAAAPLPVVEPQLVPVQTAAPVALPAAWANGVATLPFAETSPAQDFSSLLSGEVPSVPSPTPSKAKRRGLFGRRSPKASPLPPTAAALPVLPAVILPAPPAADVAPPTAPLSPARPSVWSTNGSHVQQGWAPTDEGSTAEGGLPAAQELASLSVHRPVAEAPVVAEATPGFGIASTVAPAPAVAAGNSWTPDPNGVEAHSYPAWTAAQRTAAAPAPAGDEADVSGPVPTEHAREVRPAEMPLRTWAPAKQGFATFVPSDSREVDSIGLRAGIAQQALAELSMLSSYRPQTVGRGSTPPLVRRTPAVIPTDAPTTPRQPAAPRDANEVRSLLASFQSGTSRGRTAVEETEPEITADAAAKQGTSW